MLRHAAVHLGHALFKMGSISSSFVGISFKKLGSCFSSFSRKLKSRSFIGILRILKRVLGDWSDNMIDFSMKKCFGFFNVDTSKYIRKQKDRQILLVFKVLFKSIAYNQNSINCSDLTTNKSWAEEWHQESAHKIEWLGFFWKTNYIVFTATNIHLNMIFQFKPCGIL